MKILKISLILLLAVLLGGCNVKVNINSDGNLNKIPEVSVNATDNTNQSINTNSAVSIVPEIVSTTEGAISQIKNTTDGTILIDNVKELCGLDVKVYAKPSIETMILVPFNPGSDRPMTELYKLNIAKKECIKLNASDEFSDFGSIILSPNQTKLVLALETNEANILKLIDLVNDTTKVLVTLPEGETLNGGYGALSNHFDIKWLDDKTIQYTVYKDTVKNYDKEAPEGIEDVLQVRIVKIE